MFLTTTNNVLLASSSALTSTESKETWLFPLQSTEVMQSSLNVLTYSTCLLGAPSGMEHLIGPCCGQSYPANSKAWPGLGCPCSTHHRPCRKNTHICPISIYYTGPIACCLYSHFSPYFFPPLLQARKEYIFFYLIR